MPEKQAAVVNGHPKGRLVVRKLIALAASAACFAVSGSIAPAATVQLDGETFGGTGYTYTYGGALAPTEGVSQGAKLVILDFAGYVAGSIFSPYAFLTGSVEATTSGIVLTPGITDDPSLPNLVFTYSGPPFQTTPSGATPYTPIDFSGLSAQSIYGATTLDGFSTLTVKNEGSGVGTMVYATGQVAVPVVPEPGTWALLAVGFGSVGMAVRRSRRQASYV